MMKFTLICMIPVLCLCGCSWLTGGTDTAIAEAKKNSEAAIAEARDAKDRLDETASRFAAGLASRADVEAAISAFDLARGKADSAVDDLNAKVDEASRKHADLSSWGATAGSIFGPVGTAVGGLLGTLASGILAWRKSKSLRGLIAGVQSARAELHKENPAAGAVLDERMRKAIPNEIQDLVRALKKRGVIPDLRA